MESFAFATIKELKTLLVNKEVTPEEVLAASLARFKQQDPQIGAALEVFEKQSIIDASEHSGALHGIPGLIKDNISQHNRGLTCASKILADFKSPYDATAVARLKQAGAYLVGRANMDEFAMGSSGETSAFFPTKNPWNTACVPGGSSSGSAAAVAAGFVPWALGSDTGGSVRQPAAFCGILGLKPTYGLVSRYGLVAYGSSLDQIGIFARTAYDTAFVLSTIAGNDPHDSSSLSEKPKEYIRALDGKLPEGLRIGVVDNALHAEGMDPEVVQAIEQAIAQYEKMGAKISRMQLPTLDYTAAAYFIISRAEAASNLARFDGVRYGMRTPDARTLREMYFKTRHDGFGAEVKARIMVGNYVLSAGHADAFYSNAKKVQRLIRREFVEAFADLDMLIMPTHPAPAFTFGAYKDDKLKMDLQDYFTCAMNLSGNPALSIPCGMSSTKMPIGMQLVGPHLSEERLLQAAHAFEQVTDWHTMKPSI